MVGENDQNYVALIELNIVSKAWRVYHNLTQLKNILSLTTFSHNRYPRLVSILPHLS